MTNRSIDFTFFFFQEIHFTCVDGNEETVLYSHFPCTLQFRNLKMRLLPCNLRLSVVDGSNTVQIIWYSKQMICPPSNCRVQEWCWLRQVNPGFPNTPSESSALSSASISLCLFLYFSHLSYLSDKRGVVGFLSLL